MTGQGDGAARDRDVVSEARDKSAEARLETAEDRDRAAVLRDRGAQDRDDQAHLRDLHAGAAAPREETVSSAKSDRVWSAADRDDAADDRARAVADRVEAAGDRSQAASDRHEAADDRAREAIDRSEAVRAHTEALRVLAEAASTLAVISADKLIGAQRLAAIVESARDAIISTDSQGTILTWNPSAERVYGYTAREAVGGSVSMLLPPDRTDEVVEVFARFARGERPAQFETQRVRKDGALIDVSLTVSPITGTEGEIVGATAISRDITERKAAADQHLHRLAAIVETSTDAMVSWRTSDDVVLTWNAAAERLFGWSAAEMVSTPGGLNRLLTDEHSGAIRDSLERGEVGLPIEARLQRKDASEIVVSVAVSELRDASGEATGVALVLRDLTAQRRLEEQLRQSQKMEAIGNLAGGVAHDFNNILTVIRGNAEIVLKSLGEHALGDRIREIDNAAKLAATLTGQLLAFSRQQVLQREAVDLNVIVVATCDLIARVIGEHIELDRHFGADPAVVTMDHTQLQQVVLNLCVNGRDAMPDGGVLSVRTANVALDDAYVMSHLDVKPGQYVLLEVTDTGIGMDADIKARIFDPFFTTKPEGTGLGLSTVYGVVKQSGGQIVVYSEPGIGTTFTVYLPQAATDVAQVRVEHTTPAVSRGNETILFVEDFKALRTLGVRILESAGYTVLAAANGTEALAIFEEHSGEIDLLLTDVLMPQMNGKELADQMLARRPDLRILFTSGYPAHTAIDEQLTEGRVAFIQKPYATHELATKIRSILDGQPQ
jgi:PAS domain S-box-containing protein